MDGITVITGPRTGAGHLMALARNFEAVAVADDLFAAGHQNAGGRLDLFEIEARAAHKSAIVIKATSALPRDVVEGELLARLGMRAIFVVRRPIDAYVSAAKAAALDAWRDTDLTAVKVKLDPERFAAWLEAETAWYAHWKDWLARRAFPVPVLRYEMHLTLPPEAVLKRFAALAAQVGITLAVPAVLPHPGLRRQDRGNAAAFKVRNWPEFSRALSAQGIEKRAFGYPI